LVAIGARPRANGCIKDEEALRSKAVLASGFSSSRSTIPVFPSARHRMGMRRETTKPSCEVYDVKHESSFRWKWRHLGADGAMIECEAEFELFFDCVLAARAQGYEPTSRWTGPLLFGS
jgi:hypothetical protein